MIRTHWLRHRVTWESVCGEEHRVRVGTLTFPFLLPRLLINILDVSPHLLEPGPSSLKRWGIRIDLLPTVFARHIL